MRNILLTLAAVAALGLAAVAWADGDANTTVELKIADILNIKGDGPDGKGNTNDDTWQFWFELAHKRGTYHHLDLPTMNMSASRRKSGIRGKVTGPIGSRLPNPGSSEGWIYHSDWDGRFEGVWADKKTGKVSLFPYVEKNTHGAVAISYKVPSAGTYTIAGKLTDLMVRPNYPKHDGITWIVETANGPQHGRVLKKGKPIGDGKGRPDSAEFKVEGAKLKAGESIRLVVHPNRWWGTDLTQVDYLKITRTGD